MLQKGCKRDIVHLFADIIHWVEFFEVLILSPNKSVIRACLNFAQLYFECCFRGYFSGYFSGVLRNVAGYVTKYAGKRDRKEAQKKLNINIKEENLNRL